MARLGSMTLSPAASVSGHSLVREGEGGRRTHQGVVMGHDRRTYQGVVMGHDRRTHQGVVMGHDRRTCIPVRGYCGGGFGKGGCGICRVNGTMDDLMIHYQTIPLLVLIKDN